MDSELTSLRRTLSKVTKEATASLRSLNPNKCMATLQSAGIVSPLNRTKTFDSTQLSRTNSVNDISKDLSVDSKTQERPSTGF
jgi:hypothetical protein